MGRTINSLIKDATIKSGRTVTTLSKLTGISYKRLSRLLDDKLKTISPTEYYKICKALDIDMETLLNEYKEQL